MKPSKTFNKTMDITVIGDTHGCHRQLDLKPGEMLIHTGDVSAYGLEHEFLDFMDWMESQPFIHKVFVGGNHDLYLQNNKELARSLIPDGVIYLENETVKIKGLKIYGTPASLFQGGMAFNYHAGQEIEKEWEKIPGNTDILITHMPPRGILDNEAGCPQLLEKVDSIRPKLHLFGHIHEGYGKYEGVGTIFCNAAVSNSPDFVSEVGYRVERGGWRVVI
ncbi:metallophosphatase domain-containing protein [Marinilabilia salmonicolor]|jgi:Icc-related predicted phosphoesterase|uniref:Calcineurin-like phosphoesterase family protein n=1 Tax=Marinilabilia salmonicolor TaxID=989 RepID=A0A2T0XH87_9BACT|nr:metallophosphatase domain-containing protein [Marinilabilia salmonicolor]PRY98282.1 calcineurin-like phosphoesterase family protein [Marinilabilia salmonicolor]RCW33856.1 calcineurin-like phosphoesterase family protein [Marinilabilia salmonicolor]